MSQNTAESELPTPGFLLDEFLKEYYHLFVLVSVFGVLGVYLSWVQNRGIYGDDLSALLDIAVAASLTLVVLMSTYIDFIFVFIYTNEFRKPTAVFSKKNILLAFFLVPFNALVLALIVVLARSEQTYFVVSLFSFIGGILIYGIVSPRLFRFFTWQAESEGYGSFLGFVAFGVYNVLLFAGALLTISSMMGQFSGLIALVAPFASDYTTVALLYFVIGIATMPVVMLLGLLLYIMYYKIG